MVVAFIPPDIELVFLVFDDFGAAGSQYALAELSFHHLDSPSTTAAVTYKLYQKRTGGDGTPSVNRNSNNQTQMIAMEVSA